MGKIKNWVYHGRIQVVSHGTFEYHSAVLIGIAMLVRKQDLADFVYHVRREIEIYNKGI